MYPEIRYKGQGVTIRLTRPRQVGIMDRVQGRVKLDMTRVIYMQVDSCSGIRDLLGILRGKTIMSSIVSLSGKMVTQATVRGVFRG